MDPASGGGRAGPRPCILLVEDHEPLRLLVEMTLEVLDVEVLACIDVPQARALLARRPVDLLITDLMLPGESGLVLVRELRERPPRPGRELPVLALTAGATAADRRALEALGVRHVMTKPVPAETLLAAVQEALGRPDATAQPADVSRGPGPTPAAFAGDRALYLAFLASCQAQFPRDMAQGDAACAGADLAALRRLAHSLKSVLLSLGHPEGAAGARALEDHCAAGRGPQAAAQWRSMRPLLERLSDA